MALIAVGLAAALGWAQLVMAPRLRAIPEQAGTVSSKRWLIATVAVVLTAGLAVQSWFRPGTTIATGDISVPNGTAWLERLFEPWAWTGSNLGEPSQLPLLLPWAAVLEVVRALGGEPELAQRIWYTTLFIAAGVGAFGLLAALKMGPVAALVGAIVYVFNPYVVSGVNINYVYLAALSLLVAVPAVVVAVGTGRLSVRLGVVLLVLTAPMVGYVYQNPPLVGMVIGAGLAAPLVVGWVDGREAAFRSVRTLSLASPLLLAASAFWIVPAILHLSGVGSGQLASISSWSWTESRATIRNAFWLNTIWAWSFPQYNPFAAAYDVLPLSLLRFALPAVAFSALALGPSYPLRSDGSSRSDRALRLAVAAGTAATIIIFLSTGTNPPGNVAFDFLYGLPFGWLLREPGRFLMVVALAYSVLIAAVVDMLLANRSRSRFKLLRPGVLRALRASAAPLALGTALCLGFPLYTGAIVPDTRSELPPAHVTMPSYWKEMAGVVDRLPIQGALLVMPPDDFYAMPYTWGYYGTEGFVVDLFHRHIVVPNAQGYSSTSPELLSAVNLTAQSILAHDWRQVETLAAALNTPLILVRHDIDTHYPGRVIVPPNNLAQALKAAPNFSLIRTIGSLDLFALTNRIAETEVVRDFRTVNNQAPDLRLLSVLPASTALVTGVAQRGIPYVLQAPALELWQDKGDRLVWQAPVPTGWTYGMAELDSKTVVALDHAGTFTAGSAGTSVAYAPNVPNVEVSLTERATLSNGTFASGLWGPVGDCNAVLPAPRPYLSAAVVANGAPGGFPALQLSATADSACESQMLAWQGGPLFLTLMIHAVEGSPPRLCLWEFGAGRCASLPNIPQTTGWSEFRATVTPDPGTSAISLFLYADVNGPGSRTVNEYANVRVVEVPALPTFALLANPDGPPASFRQLVVHRSTFSSQWQGSTGGEHVMVDGMLNGWLVPLGSSDRFVASYRAAGVFRASEWISLLALLITALFPVWLWLIRLVLGRSRRALARL
ncbi:MAG TPA: hypothetical protein VGU71_16050 [Candidatus Dormibacteraeota bacterium]|nr:hypothetical protein [Candidatus Dormibacteraeota bacterium]